MSTRLHVLVLALLGPLSACIDRGTRDAVTPDTAASALLTEQAFVVQALAEGFAEVHAARLALERFTHAGLREFPQKLDRAWLAQIGQDHARTIALFQSATRSPQVCARRTALAQAPLPALREYTQTVQRLQSGLDRQ